MKMPDWEIRLNEAEQARLRPIGYWRSQEQPALPDPATHIDAAWDEAERRATLSYLRQAPVCGRFWGYSTCRLCGQSGEELGDGDRTDGKWIWPSGLPHYLEQHAVRPPEEFLRDLRDAGFRLRGPIVPVETTIGRLDPNLLRGMVRSEEAHLVRLRLQRTATPRDPYLGVEVDRALGCCRLEVNDAALAAARLRNERRLHPPLWLRALRAALPLLGALLFALPFTWLVRRCSAVPGRQATAAPPRGVGANQAGSSGVQRLLPAGKYRAIHFTRMIPASLVLAGALLFAAPAAYMVETQTGLAAWLIAQQLRLFGAYFVVSTMVVVMLMELFAVGGFVLVIALAAKRLTGRTLVELSRGQRRRPEAP